MKFGGSTLIRISNNTHPFGEGILDMRVREQDYFILHFIYLSMMRKYILQIWHLNVYLLINYQFLKITIFHFQSLLSVSTGVSPRENNPFVPCPNCPWGGPACCASVVAVSVSLIFTTLFACLLWCYLDSLYLLSFWSLVLCCSQPPFPSSFCAIVPDFLLLLVGYSPFCFVFPSLCNEVFCSKS